MISHPISPHLLTYFWREKPAALAVVSTFSCILQLFCCTMAREAARLHHASSWPIFLLPCTTFQPKDVYFFSDWLCLCSKSANNTWELVIAYSGNSWELYIIFIPNLYLFLSSCFACLILARSTIVYASYSYRTMLKVLVFLKNECIGLKKVWVGFFKIPSSRYQKRSQYFWASLYYNKPLNNLETIGNANLVKKLTSQ